MPKPPLFGVGDPFPGFDAAMPENPRFSLSMLGGRWVVLAFLGRADIPVSARFVEQMGHAALPDTDDVFRCAISVARSDQTDPVVTRAFPHGRVILDAAGAVAATGRCAVLDGEGKAKFYPRWYVLDPQLRVFAAGKLDQVDELLDTMLRLPAPHEHAGVDVQPWAPVLLIPRVLEPELCRELVAWHERGEAVATGVMVTEQGQTVARADVDVKRRRDVQVDQPKLRDAVRRRIQERIAPELAKVFRFSATRIERDVVVCYDAHDRGFFRAHRDDTSPGTAHRRFAVTLNLNTGEYAGGQLRFPEYGSRCYDPPLGAALVFSCSLLHEVLPVTQGRRYASVPFLYDESAARQRANNNRSG